MIVRRRAARATPCASDCMLPALDAARSRGASSPRTARRTDDRFAPLDVATAERSSTTSTGGVRRSSCRCRELPHGYHRVAIVAERRSAREVPLVVAPSAATSRPRSRTARASGGRASSSTACARSATGASATSPTWQRSSTQLGRARRGHRRHQSAARAVPARPAAREPLQPVEPAVPQPALHRRRGGGRLRRMRAGARRWSQAGAFRERLARAARRRRWSTTPALRAPSARCSSCSTRISRAAPRSAATQRAARLRAFPARRRRARCACTRCSKRCRSIASRRRAAWGWPAGRGVSRPAARRGRATSRASTPSASSTTRTCSGRPTCSWRRRSRARRGRDGVGLYTDLAVSIDRGGAEAGRTRTLYALRRERRRAARRVQREGPGLGTAAARTRRGCASAATRRSSRRCAPTCATRARCASTT